MGPADEKRLAQAVEDLNAKSSIRGASARDGTIYIRPASPTARELIKRAYMNGYNDFPVVVEQAHVRRPVKRRRKGILRIEAKVDRSER